MRPEYDLLDLLDLLASPEPRARVSHLVYSGWRQTVAAGSGVSRYHRGPESIESRLLHMLPILGHRCEAHAPHTAPCLLTAGHVAATWAALECDLPLP